MVGNLYFIRFFLALKNLLNVCSVGDVVGLLDILFMMSML